MFDDVIGARLNTVRTALNTVSDVLGLALDCAALSPQDGCAASLEPVELLKGQSAVAVGADGRGYAVTRLERCPNRDQDDALSLAGNGLEACLLGQDATSGGPTCLLGGRAGAQPVLWADVVVRRTDALAVPLLCLAEFRFRVAAAFLAAA